MFTDKKRYSIKDLEDMFNVDLTRQTFTDKETGRVTETLYTEEEKKVTQAPYYLKLMLEDKMKADDES